MLGMLNLFIKNHSKGAGWAQFCVINLCFQNDQLG